MQYTIGVIGHGFVGKAIDHGFSSKGLTTYKYDKYQDLDSLDTVITKSDIIFVCLPTPFKEDRIDLSIMDTVFKDIAAHPESSKKVFVIKSTVVPGTTNRYRETYPHLHIAFNPEFLTEANYLEDFLNPDRTAIGTADPKSKEMLEELYATCFLDVPLIKTDPTSAELSKYMANMFLATKVIFANEFYDLAHAVNASYEDAVEIVGKDHRIGPYYFHVTPERGFGKKCFPKDLIAITGLFKDLGLEPDLLEAVWSKNLKIRKDKDWERIPFVETKDEETE